MKARIPPKNRLSRSAIKAVNEYAAEKSHDELTRFLKMVNVVLNRYFKLGKKRLNRFNSLLRDEMMKHQGDPALWVTVDRILIDEIGLPFQREDYERREQAMIEAKKIK